jgi:hypothetical protein
MKYFTAFFCVMLVHFFAPSIMADSESNNPSGSPTGSPVRSDENAKKNSTESPKKPYSVTNHLPSMEDKSGTNPHNFQHQVSFYNEYTANPDGTVEDELKLRYWVPIYKRQVNARLTLPILDLQQDGSQTYVGFGDVKLKVKWIFYRMAFFGMSASVEFGFPTSTNLILGSGVYTLAPKMLFSFQLPLKFQLALSYRGTFDYAKRWSDADDIHQGLIKLEVIWNEESHVYWFALEPRVTIDYENGGDPYMEIRARYGHRLHKGLSFYIEPGVGIGANIAEDPDAGLFRSYNWYLETGLKWVFGFFGS